MYHAELLPWGMGRSRDRLRALCWRVCHGHVFHVMAVQKLLQMLNWYGDLLRTVGDASIDQPGDRQTPFVHSIEWVMGSSLLGPLGFTRRLGSSGSRGRSAWAPGGDLIGSRQRIGQPIRSGTPPGVPTVKKAPLFMKPQMERSLKREPTPLAG
jgi:hypothetical protein